MRAARVASLWGPVVAFMAGLYALAAPESLVEVGPGWDKLVHAAAYGGFAILCLRAFQGGLLVPRQPPGVGPWRLKRLRARTTISALLLAAGYGAVDELHQMSVAGRDPSVFDWSADAVGAGLAMLVLAVWATLGASTPRRAEGP